jgi:hypothetical protein
MKNESEEKVRKKYIFRKTKKEKWKAVKYNSLLNMQREHIKYCLNISNKTGEIWKKKWKQKIIQMDKMLHKLKNIETKYNGFNYLHPKVDLKQFGRTINLGDTPIEFLNHSAVLQDALSFNQHCTGNKGGYESAAKIQLSSKNLDCRSKSGFYTEKVIVNCIKDVNSTKVSIMANQPKEYSNLSYKANSLDNTPTQRRNRSAALLDTLSINLHCTGSKDSCAQAYFYQMLGGILFAEDEKKNTLKNKRKLLFGWKFK